MKQVLFLCIFLSSYIVNADPNLEMVVSSSETEAQAVEDCAGCDTNSSLAPITLVTIEDTVEHFEKISDETWGNSCSEFVHNGEIGQYGEMVRKELTKSNQFLNIKRGDSDLVSLCPKYSEMNDSSKANVFLLILSSMAFEESSCNNSKSARGPNGTAKGLFQLHLGKEARYAPECSNYDSRTVEGSITCALGIINKQMAEGPLFRQESNYWDVLRPKRWSTKRRSYFNNPSYEQIRNAIAEFAPCQG